MWLDEFNAMRKESGLSLDDLSAKSGVPKGTLAKITSGITKDPSVSTMRNLVHAMGHTLDDLFPDTETKKSPGADKSEPRDAIEREFISLLHDLRPAQRSLALSLLKTAVAENQGKPDADQASVAEKAQEISRQGSPK